MRDRERNATVSAPHHDEGPLRRETNDLFGSPAGRLRFPAESQPMDDIAQLSVQLALAGRRTSVGRKPPRSGGHAVSGRFGLPTAAAAPLCDAQTAPPLLGR